MCQISVVIPTQNRSAYLEKLFCSLTKQTLDQKAYEILLIDNGSTDWTEKLRREWKTKFSNFRYIFDDNPGLHIGRNIGYQQSRSDIIVFADDDIVATNTWLEAIVEGFQKHKEAVLIGGSDIPQFEEAPPKWVKTLWVKGADGERILTDFSCILIGNRERRINPYFVFGCNFAVRKWILDKTHGFHPDASVYHFVTKQRMSYQYIEKIAYRSGISDAYTRLRNGEDVPLRQEKRSWQIIGRMLNGVQRRKECEFEKGKLFLAQKYKALLNEQNVNSPHLYLQDIDKKKKYCCVVDAGASEGIYSLDIIDRCNKLYIIECDSSWNEALQATVSPYQSKVIFCNKYLGDKTDNADVISLDELLKKEN